MVPISSLHSQRFNRSQIHYVSLIEFLKNNCNQWVVIIQVECVICYKSLPAVYRWLIDAKSLRQIKLHNIGPIQPYGHVTLCLHVTVIWLKQKWAVVLWYSFENTYSAELFGQYFDRYFEKSNGTKNRCALRKDNFLTLSN